MWVTGRGQEETHVEIEVVTWPLMLVNTTSLACRVMDCPLVLMRGWAAAMCAHCSGGGAQTEKWRANAKRREHISTPIWGFVGKAFVECHCGLKGIALSLLEEASVVSCNDS